jgi:hypothetical protein
VLSGYYVIELQILLPSIMGDRQEKGEFLGTKNINSNKTISGKNLSLCNARQDRSGI